MQAVQTFVADVDGAVLRVVKGEVLPDSHPLVKLDKSGVLFKTFDTGEDAPKRARAAARKPAGKGDS
jgi:hypothetical protein